MTRAVSSLKSFAWEISRPRKMCSSRFPKVNGAQFVAHAPIANHLAGQVGGSLQVVAGAGGEMLKDQFLGSTAAQQYREGFDEILFGVGMPFIQGQLLGEPQGPAPGNNGDFVDGVGARDAFGYQGVTGLMIGGIGAFPFVRIRLLRSVPMRTLSLASSKSGMVTDSLPCRAASKAASLTRLSRSAPENPGVPRPEWTGPPCRPGESGGYGP